MCLFAAFLKEPLDEYINALSNESSIPIRVLHQNERQGLVGARLLGASHANGSVLTFMESHLECNEGWLEPLLARIAEDRTRIVEPVIDVIYDDTFQYRPTREEMWTGFDWRLRHLWLDVPKREMRRRAGDVTSPFR